MDMLSWQKIVLSDGILRESNPDDRLVLWVPGNLKGGFRYWERVSNVPGSPITVERGVCAAAAVVNPARQRIRGRVGELLARLPKPPSDRACLLPNGDWVERGAERRTDEILAWPDVESEILDEARVRSRWPDCSGVRRLGPTLLLVSGGDTQGGSGSMFADSQKIEAYPRAAVRRMLAVARQSGDSLAEATALVDLGVMRLREGKVRNSLVILEKAAAMAHQLDDRLKESDALGNLGRAAFAVGQRKRARDAFQRSLATAREAHDGFAEKIALEQLGTLLSRSRRLDRAMSLLEMALSLARETGDGHHEAQLLWRLAVVHAQLDQFGRAIDRARASIAVFEGLGRPEATWFAMHLQKFQLYRAICMSDGSGLVGTQLSPPNPSISSNAEGATSDPKTTPAQDHVSKMTGPRLLGMAGPATKSLARFVRSGSKPLAFKVHQERLRICAGCDYLSGLRCRVSGCFTNVVTQLSHEQCPLRRWPEFVDTHGLAHPTDARRKE